MSLLIASLIAVIKVYLIAVAILALTVAVLVIGILGFFFALLALIWMIFY